MFALPDRWRQRASHWEFEEGFTLPELIIGAAVTVIMLGAILPVIWISNANWGGQSDRVTALAADRVAFDAITWEIRQAGTVHAPAGGEGQILIMTGGSGETHLDCGIESEQQGRFKCVLTKAGARRELLDGLTNTDPFRIAADGYVAVDMQLTPPGAETPVSLQGGAAPRVTTVAMGN